MAIIAIVIFVGDPKGSPIFVQYRVGKDGKRFRFYKFRSMCMDAEAKLEQLQHMNEMKGAAFKITNDPRVTRVGRFIRRWSIDELPQLFNVLKGDMSIVGPRPPLQNEVAQYGEYEWQRLLVKPGLTCFWQVKGRNQISSFEDWVDLDIQYISKRNISLDIKLIGKTFSVVFEGRAV
jgi:lipopolysaccharide/colanic/teichoic acid biosynthesis glycosyltransferase